jgi:hypothetical protein
LVRRFKVVTKTKTRAKKGGSKAKGKTRNETVKIGGKRLPRFAYRDTPEGTWREDRKMGELIWRKLGNDFPPAGK